MRRRLWLGTATTALLASLAVPGVALATSDDHYPAPRPPQHELPKDIGGQPVAEPGGLPVTGTDGDRLSTHLWIGAGAVALGGTLTGLVLLRRRREA